MVLFNFRSDRMVEISKAFEYEEFNAFDRKRFPKASTLSIAAHAFLLHLHASWVASCVELLGTSHHSTFMSSIMPVMD